MITSEAQTQNPMRYFCMTVMLCFDLSPFKLNPRLLLFTLKSLRLRFCLDAFALTVACEIS